MLAAGKPDTTVGWMIVARDRAARYRARRVHRARGEPHRAQQIETELAAELAQSKPPSDAEQPRG
jgi:hypothetical protein